LNRFLVREEPWKIAKDPARAADLRAVLRACAEGVRSVALWSAPVMPGASRRALTQLGIPGDPHPGDLAAWHWDQIPGGAAIARGEPLFPRADPVETLARIQALEESAVSDSGPTQPPGAPVPPGASPEPRTEAPTLAPTAASATASGLPQIEIDQFMQVELRTARVEQAERVPKADKLLRLVVDLGGEKRQIVAGIAAKYAPEELVGRTIVIVANL